MCLNPIVKQSNKKYFLPNRWESFYNTFPCGECEECRQNRELDEYVRTNWESKYAFNELGGYAIFDTLSYRPECLAHVSDVLEDLDMHPFRGELPSGLNLSCFRLADWRNFLLNLNSRVTNLVIRKIQDVLAENYELDYGQRYIKKNIHDLFDMAFGRVMPNHWFNYVMASEYGHDKDYIDDRGRLRHGTVRPHYHVVFFSYLPSYILAPEDFSHAVSEAWHRGRTDGVDWPCKKHKTKYEWKRCRVFEEADSTFHINVLNVLSYISKYMHKDEGLKEKFGKIEEFLFNWIYAYEYDDYWKVLSGDYEVYKEWKRLKRNLFNFSKHGHDFGAYYIDWLNKVENSAERDRVCKTGYIVMEMNKSQTKYNHTLPTYYANKLFKEPYWDSKGYKHWRWNSLGLSFKEEQIKSSIKNMIKKFNDFLLNTDDVEVHKMVEDGGPKFLEHVAVWYRLYEGRMLPTNVRWIDVGHIDKDCLPSAKEMIKIIVANMQIDCDSELRDKILNSKGKKLGYDGEQILFNYSSPSDVAFFGRAFLTNKNLGTKDDYKDGYNKYVDYKPYKYGWNIGEDKFIPFSSKGDFDVIDNVFFGVSKVLRCSMVYGYENYGKFMALYRKYIKEVSDKKQEVKKFKRELEARQKVLGLKKNNAKDY